MKSINRKLTVVILAIILVLPIICACTNKNEPVEEPPNIDWDFYNEKAVMFVMLTVNGELETAMTMFDDDMAKAMNTDKIQEMWLLTTTTAGDFISIHDVENRFVDGYFISTVIMRHQETGFGWRIAFSEDGLIAGLHTAGTQSIPD